MNECDWLTMNACFSHWRLEAKTTHNDTIHREAQARQVCTEMRGRRETFQPEKGVM